MRLIENPNLESVQRLKQTTSFSAEEKRVEC